MIRDRLERDKTWRQKTLLGVDDVMELLEFILTTTYFSFRTQIYRQKFGTAMGSSISPLVLLWQEQEEELNKLLLAKFSDRDRNIKVNKLGLCYEVIYI